jgi:protein lysine acetyltransferase
MDTVELRSGREVLIRPICAGDGPALSAAYDALSHESKYSRFLAPKPHLSAAETRYLVQVDGQDHVALVATPADGSDRILGVGRFVRMPDAPDTAELAVVVGDPFQHEGLATELLTRLTDAALERGITRLSATMLAGNVPAHRLVESLAGRLAHEQHTGIVDELIVELAS